MVKAPTTRHAKSSRKPVTLDLEAQKAAPSQAGEAFSASPSGSASSFDEKPGDLSGHSTTERTAEAGDSFAAPAEQTGPANEGAPSDTLQPVAEDRAGRRDDDSASSTAAAANAKAGPSASPASDGPALRDVDANRSTSARGAGGLLAAAIVGGAVALGGYALLDRAGVFGESGSNSEIAALQAEVAALRDAPPADGSGAVAALEAEISDLSARMESLRESATTQAPAEPDPRVAELAGRVEALEARGQTVVQAQGSTEDEIASLRRTLDDLAERVEASAGDRRLELALSASALKSAIESGQPFGTELDAFASVSPDAPEVGALRDMAAGGVPGRAEIAAELPEAADAMVAAARPAPEGGVVNRLWSSATSLVEVRPVGASVTGSEPPAIVARLEAAVQANDYAKALAEYETLPDAAKNAGADFMAKVRARETADQLVGRTLSRALTAVPKASANPAGSDAQPSAPDAPPAAGTQ